MHGTRVAVGTTVAVRLHAQAPRRLSCARRMTTSGAAKMPGGNRVGKLLQNVNTEGVRLFLRTCFGEKYLAVPHMEVRDISTVNWKALRAAGFEGCVFDKDNTLTVPYVLKVYDPLQQSLEECQQAFDGRLAILSNSAGLQQYDPDGTLAAALQEGLGVPVLRHGSKKPAGSPQELEAHFGCPAEKLIMVGDRYFTDIVYGNLNGMLTIRPAPFTEKGETAVVKAVRRFEDWLVHRWQAQGVRAADHPLVPSPFAAFEHERKIETLKPKPQWP